MLRHLFSMKHRIIYLILLVGLVAGMTLSSCLKSTIERTGKDVKAKEEVPHRTLRFSLGEDSFSEFYFLLWNGSDYDKRYHAGLSFGGLHQGPSGHMGVASSPTDSLFIGGYFYKNQTWETDGYALSFFVPLTKAVAGTKIHVPGKDVYFFRSGGRPGLHPTADARITVEECIVVFDSVEMAKDDAESYATGSFELVIPDGETTISSKDGRFDVGDHAPFIPQYLILEYQFVIKTDTDV